MADHTNRMLRSALGLAAVASVVLIPTASSAQSFDDVRAALQKSDMSAALAAARADALANPSDATAQDVQGILEMAAGNVSAAETAFTNAINQGDALDPSKTGLEKFYFDGSPLQRGLNRQKVTIALGAGGAAAYNNRAAARIVEGHIEDALSDLDDAMRREPHWGVPSANAAVAWLENNSPHNAKRYARQALNFHERTAKVFTSMAEAQMRQKDWQDADQSLKQAEQKDRSFPWELYVRYLWYTSRNRATDAEHALFQALSLDPNVASEDRNAPRNIYHASGGSGNADHERFFESGHLHQLPFQSIVQRDRESVENRTDAYQRRDFSQTILGRIQGNTRSGLFASFLNENGGRPGSENQFSVPGATFGFRRTDLAAFRNFNITPNIELDVVGVYRHNSVTSRSSAAATPFHPLRDDQFGVEGRIDTLIHRTHLFAGYAWYQNKRDEEMAPVGDPLNGPEYASPVEPNDQLLDPGTSVMTSAYTVAQKPIAKNVTAAAGPVAASNGKSVFALPYVDLNMKQSHNVSYRLAALPRMMNVGSNLMPVSMQSGPVRSNPIDQYGDSTNGYNHIPYIEGPNGRVESYEFSMTKLMGEGNWLTATAFHRDFSNMSVISQDPDVSPILLVANIPHGQSTGVEAYYTQPLPGGFTLSLSGVAQQSRGSYDDPGAPTTLPYSPTLRGTAVIGYDRPTWSISVHTTHVGQRTAIVHHRTYYFGGGFTGGPLDFTATEAPATTLVDIVVTGHLANGHDISFHLQPASSSSYYANYPEHPLVSVSYDAPL